MLDIKRLPKAAKNLGFSSLDLTVVIPIPKMYIDLILINFDSNEQNSRF
jgi:hypothetical protein